MNAKAGRLLAAVILILALCTTGCLAQELEAVAAGQPAAGEAESPLQTAGQQDGEDARQAETPAEPLPAQADEAVEAQAQEQAEAQAQDQTPEQARGQASQDEEQAAAALERIKVTMNRSALQPGQRARAQVAFYPQGAAQVDVSWSSSDPQVAAVDEGGLVRVIAGAGVPDEGMDVDIWARATDGSLAMDCVTVRVLPAVKALTMLDGEVQLSLADKRYAGVAVRIEPASLVGLAEVTWESSDETVVTVSGSGAGEVAMLYAQGPGRATITARAQDFSGFSDTLTVVVE